MEYSDSVCGRGDRARCAFLELALQGHPSIGDFQHGGKPLTVASELVTRLHAKGYERLPGGEPPVMFQGPRRIRRHTRAGGTAARGLSWDGSTLLDKPVDRGRPDSLIAV